MKKVVRIGIVGGVVGGLVYLFAPRRTPSKWAWQLPDQPAPEPVERPSASTSRGQYK